MIAIETPSIDNSYKIFMYATIIAYINSNIKDVVLWDKSKNLYDVYDEYKTDTIITLNDAYNKPIKKLNIKHWNFDNYYNDSKYIVNEKLFQVVPPSEMLACETLCLSPFNDTDKFNDTFFKYMDQSTKDFRYFGVNRFGGHKDCGMIPTQYFSIALCSANNILALSKNFAVNAYLCNKNIVNYNITDEEIESYKCANIIKDIL